MVMFRKNPDTGDVELIAAELKRDYDRTTTPEQEEWLEALNHHISAYTWRPGNWAEIDEVLQNGSADHQAHGNRRLNQLAAQYLQISATLSATS